VHHRIRSIALLLLKLAVSGGLVYFVLAGINFDDVARQLGDASVLLAGAASLVMLASHLLGVMQWRVFLRAQRLEMSFSRCVVYYYTGQFFNNLLLSSVGGDIVRMFDVAYNEKVRKGRVLASILVDRVFGLVCLIMIGLIALPFFIAREPSNLVPVMLLYAVFAGVMLLFWLFVMSRYARHLTMHLVQRLPVARLRRAGFHFLRTFYCYRRTPGAFLRALGWGLTNQAVKMGVAFITLAALTGSPGAVEPLWVIVFVPILGIVKVLPISIMGIGPHELAGRNLFGAVGVAASLTMSFLFLYQIVAILSNLACGVFLPGRRFGPRCIIEKGNRRSDALPHI